ncbi:hypothetical protein B0T26DRAFT_754438 [Lasiosphaeria miniovina]|uniref:Cyclin-D1-binding protein 1-like N-terminal domain-containing protein n=1 Tax=Lasiosphaeria miniovina TaxID=1954250 RepID=A0AA40DQ06_9PEZI|nr:uncharacterized protein B0T26DRAFT_754438 [Lasiosphaeria miniovina]KAK0709191.1 hypothetical protein B0T26DRAFT_754438 [Lasiosphaeria miniovina]
MSSLADTLATLNGVVSNALSLIDQVEAVVANIAQGPSRVDASLPTESQQGLSNASLDALSLAHDSAALIKAHATKISLFIINEPFTPTAIVKVLRELTAGPVAGLASSVQLCTAERYTREIQQDLAWQSGRVLRELKKLLSRVPKDGKVLSNDKKNASAGAAAGRGSIATTGVLWAACDDLITVASRGFAGNLVHKVEQLKDTLKDVIEELKEWGEETGGDESENGDSNDEDGEVDEITQSMESAGISTTQTTQDMLDELMNSHQYIPRDDPDKIRERLESCLRRLRLTALLYQATVKRRLKSLPQQPPSPASPIAARLDEIFPLLKRIPERCENLAMAFYDLEPLEIDRLMDQCFFDAFAVSELLVKSWNGQKDEFTDWALKFQVEIKKS